MSQTLDRTEVRVTATCNAFESINEELARLSLKDMKQEHWLHCQTSFRLFLILCHESCEEALETLMSFAFSFSFSLDKHPYFTTLHLLKSDPSTHHGCVVSTLTPIPSFFIPNGLGALQSLVLLTLPSRG